MTAYPIVFAYVYYHKMSLHYLLNIEYFWQLLKEQCYFD
jgi:hypothetical protein